MACNNRPTWQHSTIVAAGGRGRRRESLGARPPRHAPAAFAAPGRRGWPATRASPGHGRAIPVTLLDTFGPGVAPPAVRAVLTSRCLHHRGAEGRSRARREEIALSAPPSPQRAPMMSVRSFSRASRQGPGRSLCLYRAAKRPDRSARQFPREVSKELPVPGSRRPSARVRERQLDHLCLVC